MIWGAYTLHDVKALTYSPPFFAVNHATAKRMVQDLVVDLNTSVGRHPGDYKLYCIGAYEDSKGIFAPEAIMEHVVDCIALVPIHSPGPLFPGEGPLPEPSPGWAANGEAK